MKGPARFNRVAVSIFGLACLAMPLVGGADESSATIPTLLITLGYSGAVVAAAAESPASPAKCNAGGKSIVVIPSTRDRNGNSFCVTASVDALSVTFEAPASLPFASSATMQCTSLERPASAPRLISVVARVGESKAGGTAVYDGARAQCDLDGGFAYAVTVEKLGSSPLVPAGKKNATRSVTIPWSLLHLDGHSTDLMVTVNDSEFIVPLRIEQRGGAFVTDYAPFVRLSTPGPASAAQVRAHDVEINLAYSWDRRNLFAASFAQNQATVAVQRALSNALSLAPVSLPAPNMRMTIGQDLQTQSQSLFAFQQPSNYLEDQSLKPLFDVLPFSVTKLSNLASGYAYGYTSDTLGAGLFYGLQNPGTYSGGATATLILTTPAPSPAPPPPPKIVRTAAAPAHQPLRPPAPPAPFFESGTASTPPFQLSLLNGFTGNKGTRDAIDALAFEGHVYQNQSSDGSNYTAQTINVFGRLEHDFRTPAVTGPAAISRFIGESATFTSGKADDSGARYFQLRESVGAQVNDRFFSPTIGTATWLAPLSGPFAHVTTAFATGKNARYYALDLIGFRLTNENGDLAAQEGWQVSIPFGGPGWLLSGGSETQTVSDRIAAVEQGVVSYSQSISQVVHPAIRPQRLANVSLVSPWLPANGKNWQFEVTGGFNSGTVTACGATVGSKQNSPTYQCLTALDNRVVGGLFLRNGLLALGATDTTVQSGSISAGDAARNLGNAGGLPGSVTAYISFTGCPQISAAYANAAFPSGVPFPQQGTTLSSQLDYPMTFGETQLDVVLGYFNEHAQTNVGFDESGFSAVLRLGTTFRKPSTSCDRRV